MKESQLQRNPMRSGLRQIIRVASVIVPFEALELVLRARREPVRWRPVEVGACQILIPVGLDRL